ncbi:MAG: S41 family peptidase [Candidatus Kariarchaeaceae archaeon]|jgi:C-terminal processing protease CtpA/Prc
MKAKLSIFIAIIFITVIIALLSYNLMFENVDIRTQLQKAWKWGNIGKSRIKIDSTKKVEVYRAQLDSAFYDGSKINLASVNDTQIKNLSILGKIWGFLKYYHPQIAEGNYNWDFELFRILPKVISSKSKKERDNYLLDWIDELGPVIPCDTCKTHISGDYKQIPDLAWINNKNLEPMMKEKLDFIHKNRNQKNNYYVSLAPGVSNPVFKHENPYKNLIYPDTGYRILALYRYWNIVQYFSPYKYAIGEDWNKVLDESIPKFIKAKDALEYRLESLKLIGRINDTHANIWGQDSILSDYHGKYYSPVQVKFIEDQLVITGYYNNDLGEKTGLKIGDIILYINDIEVNEILIDKLPFYPASNYSTKLRDIAKNILRGNNKKTKLGILSDNKRTIRMIERYLPDSLNLKIDWAYNKPNSCYKFITENIGYIYLGNIKSNLIPTIFKKFKDTKGIVIDIRNYPSEFVVFSMGKYLVPRQMEFVKFTKGNINYPGWFDWTNTIKVGEENADFYKGKVVILINEITLSQAEYTTMAFRTSPNAVVVGSTTAGADGNVSPFYLPGNIRTMITGIGVYYSDGQETQRVGIIPDIEIKPTIGGIKNGRDELLEKAIEIIEESR